MSLRKSVALVPMLASGALMLIHLLGHGVTHRVDYDVDRELDQLVQVVQSAQSVADFFLLNRANADRATIDRATIDRATIDRATVDRATIDRATIDRAEACWAETQFSLHQWSTIELVQSSSSDRCDPFQANPNAQVAGLADDHVSREDIAILRQIRIERILLTLDLLTEVMLEMKPEQAVRIEPVLTELADQTLQLVDEEAFMDPSTDDELSRIEEIIDRFVSTLERLVESEMFI